MKNVILLIEFIIIAMIMSSCSNNDDINSNSTSIVGSWKQTSQIDFCSTGSQEIVNSNLCEQTGRFNFNENGNYSFTFYELDGIDCVLESIENGNWEITNGILSIQNEEGTFEYTDFELTESMLRIGANENSQDEPCNDGFLTNFILIFERVES